MKKLYLELYIDKGATFNNTITIEDKDTDNPINIANYTFSGQMRKSYYSQNVSGNIVCTVTGASTGRMTMSMARANTSNLVDGRYFFDVIGINTSSGVGYKVAEGIVIVQPTVTSGT